MVNHKIKAVEHLYVVFIRNTLLIIACFLSLLDMAQAGSFDGITIIKLSDDDARNVIMGTGFRPLRAEYIVTFVSGQGTYAALTGRTTECVAWAADGSYTGDSITFGVPARAATLNVTPRICQPFTLTHREDGKVSLVANNLFHRQNGPLDRKATAISYEKNHEVIARVPLVGVDWSLPIYSRNNIMSIRLGPLFAVFANLDSKIKIKEIPEDKWFGFLYRKGIEAKLAGTAISVSGRVTSKEITGWPWDVLYAAFISKRFDRVTTKSAFKQAVEERYGRESDRISYWDQPDERFLWFYDLTGRQINIDQARSDNCLATSDHWINESSVVDFNNDIGPWGCSMVMIITPKYVSDNVDGYRNEIFSGYAMALNHFFSRIRWLAEIRNQIEELEAQRPKL